MRMFNFQKKSKNEVSEQLESGTELLNSALESGDSSDPAPIFQQVADSAELPENMIEPAFDTRLLDLAPRPSTVAETGLSNSLLLDLLVKHLHIGGVYSLRELSDKLALSGGIVSDLIEQAKALAWIENRQSGSDGQMRFSLSHIGQFQAEKAFLKNGYMGRAPLPLAQYIKVAKSQSSRSTPLSKAELDKAFSGLMFPEQLIDKIGPALNSTKPILIYGKPGTGKSYFCRHLNLLFGEQVLIPYAIEVNNEIIQLFDPAVHQTTYQSNNKDLLKMGSSFDQRWLLCLRPLIITGGELTLEMLEVRFDHNSKMYQAPLQLKANNGILLLDDLGRQKVTPKALFNRWIVPLEERRDFLSLQSGLHFEVPFELLLLFSTNLSPKDLIDEAFLRRLGYKIPFSGLNKQQFKMIWDQECIFNSLSCDQPVFDYLVTDLLTFYEKDFLPCYPRDLISIIRDQIVFKKLPSEINKQLLDFAWQSYFV
ncbi:MAG: hypothetical protein ACJAZP_001824 [Psychromonas sp.]|jgi:hypothetical protein|uniref:AAA family ATPase n=1 Tax=Psychromonas sp. TaxID=1884585 RepID=UPI0039E224A1